MQLSAKQTGAAGQHPMLECAIRIGFPVGCCARTVGQRKVPS